MTKKELINALANVSDDTPIVFGVYKEGCICAIPNMVIHSDYYEMVVITNRECQNRDFLRNTHKILLTTKEI